MRCGIVPPLLLTVRDGASGAALPDADVAVAETPSDFVVRGCETAGPEFDCTHEVLGIGGHDDLRRNAEGVEPGYGPWKLHATLTVEVAIVADGFSMAAVEIDVDTDGCGMAVPVHGVVDLVPAAEPGTETMSSADAPSSCRETR